MNTFQYKNHNVEVLKIRRWKPWTVIIDDNVDCNRFASEKEAEEHARKLIDKLNTIEPKTS